MLDTLTGQTPAIAMSLPSGAEARPSILPLWPLPVLLAACTIASAYSGFGVGALPDFARLSALGFDVLALILAVLVMPRQFAVGFMGSTLCLVIAWRVGAISAAVPIMATSAICAIYCVMLYVDVLRTEWPRAASWQDRLEWQMTTLRIYFGFDMVGHFTEKLFAGSASFTHMATQFESFGLPAGGFFVLVGGLCELGIAIGVGMGLLTRLAGFGGALYFLIANHFGGHFANGFTWSNGPDGGWEYPMMMTLFYLSFALSGAGRFSIDGWLACRGLMPRWAMPLSAAIPHRQTEARA